MNDPGPARADPGEPYSIVAIAASAGGITALGRVLGGLPSGFGVPVVIVQHLRSAAQDGHRRGARTPR
jgi:two-component system, chemotaxis family, protein-glutamate methylesterase/glutaminase